MRLEFTLANWKLKIHLSDELDAQIFLQNNRTNVYLKKCIWYNTDTELKCIFNFQLARVNSSLIEITSAHIYCH